MRRRRKDDIEGCIKQLLDGEESFILPSIVPQSAMVFALSYPRSNPGDETYCFPHGFPTVTEECLIFLFFLYEKKSINKRVI